MSERRAGRIINAYQNSLRYRSATEDDDTLRERLPELANQCRRIGYRCLNILLRREGLLSHRDAMVRTKNWLRSASPTNTSVR